MKLFYLLIALLICNRGYSQNRKANLTKDLVSTDRKEIIKILKVELAKGLKLTPQLVVAHLWVRDGFAFFKGNVKNTTGKDIDFSKTSYKDAVEQGVFDGDGTVALLKKLKDKWTVVAFAIGATDVPYTCWWREFKASRDIFDYTEPCW